ncbi:MAG: cysteine--tRNA ligase [Candidatus Paceibacterota bacterium]
MISIYNSLTSKKEVFEPIDPDQVGIYTCGPTVYDRVHLGNLRAYINADIFRRVFEYNDYQVKQVINITDVGHLTNDSDDGEDKMEKRAKERKSSASELTQIYTDAFFEDINALNVRTENTLFPKATDHIKEQIDIIKKLEEKGFTYKTSDGIYFDTSKLSNYDAFQTVGNSLKQGARIEINSEKMHPNDFALWKFSPLQVKRQQEWDSPWGVGFPGWHLECSAMSMKYLGEQFDIHTGGIDHKFPHHPNEIAQSESATGKKPFVRYWMHNEFMSVENKKMAKSEGNFFTLGDLNNKGFSPLSFRYFVLGAHYRSPINFTWQALRGASNAYNKLLEHVKDLYREESPEAEPDSDYLEAFNESINNDFDTPVALALLWKLVKDKKIKNDVKLATIKNFDEVMGLNLTNSPMVEITIPKEVEKLVGKREKARAAKKWNESDDLRDKIKEKGFNVKDTPNGPKLEKLS